MSEFSKHDREELGFQPSVGYHTLKFDHLTPFILKENLRPCREFPDGVFPGAHMSSDGKYQELVVYNLKNLYQFSQIIQEEIVRTNHNFVTKSFFEKRANACADKEERKKEGEIVGYCYNGTSFHVNDISDVKTYFAQMIYLTLVSHKSEWKDLSLEDLKDENEFFQEIVKLAKMKK